MFNVFIFQLQYIGVSNSLNEIAKYISGALWFCLSFALLCLIFTMQRVHAKRPLPSVQGTPYAVQTSANTSSSATHRRSKSTATDRLVEASSVSSSRILRRSTLMPWCSAIARKATSNARRSREDWTLRAPDQESRTWTAWTWSKAAMKMNTAGRTHSLFVPPSSVDYLSP